ncbi:Alpha/Beta hydrolase protein [Lactarius psammicola]|nr:Alpha/Beta hydrolase protein [Lactarius psammicola]
MPRVELNTIGADGVKVFYRSAGPPTAPVLLLLHGFPASSFQFRELIPLLASKFRVLAPDLPGFGFTEVPAERKYQYTFDSLSLTIEAFLDAALPRRARGLALFYDYRTNPKLYPRWQEYLRASGVPVLALWGANDPIFVRAGAEAFARDVKDLVLDFVDSGHFALETHVEYFAEKMDKFLSARILKP